MKTILRKELALKDTWNLDDIYPSLDEWENDFRVTQLEAESFLSLEHTIGNSIEQLKKTLDQQAEASWHVEKLFVYAMMHRDEDNRDSIYQALADRAMALAVALDSATSFMVPEIMAIPNDTMQAWCQDEKLALYAHMLDDILRAKPHTLSSTEEKLLAMSGEMSASAQNIYKMLDYADLKFPDVETQDGEKLPLTQASYIQLMESQDRDIRKKTFDAYYNVYQDFSNTFASIFSASQKNDVFYAKARNYSSALESFLFSDCVSTRVYDQLIEVVHEKLPLMHRYVSLRKKALGLSEMHMYDLYVPLTKTDMSISYSEAIQMVKEGLHPLGDEYIDVLTKAFDSRWIDVYETEGKSSGAYSWGVYGTHPYVLMNYVDNIDSVFTLAHEMGHAMHSYYSDENQPYVKAGYPILLAEVASTVNESLLIEYLMKKEKDHDIKLRLLNYYLEQFRGTVYRQVMFAEFEKWTHEQLEVGEALTADSLSEKYRELNKLYYGDDMIIDEAIGIEWARISHFYNAFYVYKYATGFASAITISKSLRDGGEKERKQYLDFLSSGGSDYPLETLKRAGVDLEKKDALYSAFDVFEESLNELEAML